jgi:hypothetical protein
MIKGGDLNPELSKLTNESQRRRVNKKRVNVFYHVDTSLMLLINLELREVTRGSY